MKGDHNTCASLNKDSGNVVFGSLCSLIAREVNLEGSYPHIQKANCATERSSPLKSIEGTFLATVSKVIAGLSTISFQQITHEIMYIFVCVCVCLCVSKNERN